MRKTPLYRGWLVVAAAFIVAMFGFGLGFYGPGVYVAALAARRGWSIAGLSAAVTVYFMLGASLLFFCVGRWFERHGARRVVAAGAAALAAGVVLLGLAGRLWQVYAAFAVMSFGWATMSGAAINIIVAPWFERRRGAAVSWAMNGASAGGVAAPPLLILLIARLGLAQALALSAAAMLAILLPLAVVLLRPRRPDEREPGAGDPVSPPPAEVPWRLGATLRSGGFVAISLPFALALTAQVGFLTQQVALLSPLLGAAAAGWAVSVTAIAAVLGRIAAGSIADRIERRILAAGNFLVQAIGLGLLAAAAGPAAAYVGCALFGLGVGNATSLPGLIVHHEFPERQFARVVSLVVAINQFSFAFGPALLGQLRDRLGSYRPALLLCLALEAAAALVVVLPLRARRRWLRVG